MLKLHLALSFSSTEQTMKLFFQKAQWFITHFQMLRDFAARNFYKDTESIQVIRNSSFFDETYYKRNNPDLTDNKDLIAHYFEHGGFERRDPSEFFCSEEYFSINPDVDKSSINPLYDYETHDEKDERMFSTIQSERGDHFPQGTQTISIVQDPAPPVHKRTAVVSCFFHDGKIPDSLMILIRGVKEIADNLILVGDCPVFPSELEKIKNYVCYAHFERHNQYDFGSYKIGFNYARKAGLLKADTADELILINDSCYGPVYPFSELFQRMESVICDFWGINGSKKPPENIFKPHISSFFYVFRRSVINGNDIDDFLNAIHGKYDRSKVICLLELEFTQYLQKKGFLWQVTDEKCEHNIYLHPLTFLETYRIPLVKKKALKGNPVNIQNRIFSIISENCPELALCIRTELTYSGGGI